MMTEPVVGSYGWGEVLNGLLESLNGFQNHGAVSGSVIIDTAIATHVLTASGPTTVSLGPAPDGTRTTILVRSGGGNTIFDGVSFDGDPPVGAQKSVTAVRTNGAWVAVTGGAGGDITWTEPTAAEIAVAQGYWIVVDGTEPAEPEMYGVPVLWIDTSEVVAPVPANPPTPTWNDDNSTFTVPSGVAGVDYKLDGFTLIQGSTVATSGTFPRSVTVTTSAQPGYVLMTPYTFSHDFPDPAAITLITSDGFSGSAGAFTGRTTDVALGGSPLAYAAGTLNRFLLSGSGTAVPTTAVGTSAPSFGLLASTRNARVEFDIISVSGTGGEVPLNMNISRGADLTFSISPTSLGVTTGLVAGGTGGVTFQQGAFPGGATPLGHYTFQLYQYTVTCIIPDGSGGFVTRTAVLDPAIHSPVTATNIVKNVNVSWWGFNTTRVVEIDGLKISRVGF